MSCITSAQGLLYTGFAFGLGSEGYMRAEGWDCLSVRVRDREQCAPIASWSCVLRLHLGAVCAPPRALVQVLNGVSHRPLDRRYDQHPVGVLIQHGCHDRQRNLEMERNGRDGRLRGVVAASVVRRQAHVLRLPAGAIVVVALLDIALEVTPSAGSRGVVESEVALNTRLWARGAERPHAAVLAVSTERALGRAGAWAAVVALAVLGVEAGVQAGARR
eukprot:1361447-Prymnesium_polylepis.1